MLAGVSQTPRYRRRLRRVVHAWRSSPFTPFQPDLTRAVRGWIMIKSRLRELSFPTDTVHKSPRPSTSLVVCISNLEPEMSAQKTTHPSAIPAPGTKLQLVLVFITTVRFCSEWLQYLPSLDVILCCSMFYFGLAGLPFRYSSIDTQILSCHVRTCITGQENATTTNIIWCCHSSIHDFIFPTL